MFKVTMARSVDAGCRTELLHYAYRTIYTHKREADLYQVNGTKSAMKLHVPKP